MGGATSGDFATEVVFVYSGRTGSEEGASFEARGNFGGEGTRRR